MIGDGDERALLAAARRALSPTAADRERVRRATAAALAGGGGAPEGTGGPPAVRGWPWASRIAVVGTVAALAGGIGYGVGLRAGRESPPEHATPVSTGPAPDSPGVPTDPAPPVVRAAPLPLAGEARATRPAPRRRGAAAETVAQAPASLAEEVRALRAIERALRDGNPGFAMALLRELDRAVPNGQLVEERLATRTIARCASGDVPLGVNLADDFVARYPESVYGRRVVDGCAATDSPRSGDSAGRRPTQ